MILTLNAGSSSLKWSLFDADLAELDTGLFERLGEGRTHEAALTELFALLSDAGRLTGLQAVAHRVVHGGEAFREPVRITTEVEKAIERLSPLAPLHNPVNLAGIRAARQVLAEADVDVPHVAVFDTAFHATLPEYAYRYAVPEAWYTEHNVRRYGFHGTSHAYVSAEARRVLAKADRPHRKMVTLHLGNGASAAAILDGICVDTSMGLTPLEGLMMGTRPGQVDPGMAAYLAAQGVAVEDQERALNKESGLLAIGGTNDVRQLLSERTSGSLSAKLALQMFVYRIRKTVGAYAAAMDGLDALVFTAGIGENSSDVRAEVCAGLTSFGVSLDSEQNGLRSGEARMISRGETSVLVVPTNEELAMARAAQNLLEG